MRKQSRAGGGPRSNKNVSPPVRYGQPAKEKYVRGTSQIGQSLGNHITERRGTVNPIEPVRGGPIGGGLNVKLGNEVAKNVGKGGCGTGRTNYGQSGSQQQYGSANPGSAPAKNVDILGAFGPESKPR
jgi:hypothetical protein